MANDSKVEYRGIKNIDALTTEGELQALIGLALQGVNNSKSLATFAKGYSKGQTKNSIQYKIYNGKSFGMNDSSGETVSKELDIPPKHSAFVGATAEHAVFPEFGTRYMAPQPYLRPGLALLKGDAPEIVAKKMDAEFKKGKLKFGEERIVF
jgi:HK97 gp10 family phage protein